MVHARSGQPLPLPPEKLRFMSENDEQLIQVGDELAGLLVSAGLTETSSVLDVGCGYGRLALGLLHSTDYRGQYLGFDIQHRSIDWCQSAITPVFPSMRFVHLDVRNDRYNRKGTIDPTGMSFPARSASIDACALISVFTHFYRPDIERYLSEIRRVLKPGGFAVVTWFLFDDARLPAATSSDATYPMVHVLDAQTRYTKEGDPLRAIAYHEDAMRAMAAAARLVVRAVDRGTWAGEPGRVFQDVVVFERSLSDTRVDPEPKGPGVADRLAERSREVWARLRPFAGRVVRLPRRLIRKILRVVTGR
jgi:SAM-dependent methyltransferase